MKRYAPNAVIALIVLGLFVAGGLNFVEDRLLDLRSRMVSRQASGEVVVVAIDTKTVRELSAWPWARGYHAAVVEQLLDAGARRVGLLVDLSARTRPEEDLELERALARGGRRVVLPVQQEWEKTASGERLLSSGPLPSFSRHVSLATINLDTRSRGPLRRYRSHGQLHGKATPAFATALTAGRERGERLFYLDFSIDRQTIPAISYGDVLRGQFDATQIEGKAVIVGPTAIELGDRVSVPLHDTLPSSYLQALALETIELRREMKKVPAAVTILLTLIVALILTPTLETPSWRVASLTLGGVCLMAFALSYLLQALTPLILEVSPWILISIGIFAHAAVRRSRDRGADLANQNVRLRDTENLMMHVVESSFDAIVTIDANGRVEMFNAAAERMFGYPAADTIGRPVQELIVPHRAGTMVEEASALLWKTEGQHEAVGRRRNGASFPLEIAVSAIAGDEMHRRVGVIREISERKAQQRKLEHQATHDALTDLPNRVLLHSRFESSVREARENGWSVAFLMLDLDGFRQINDTLGHHLGDQLLQQIGRRLQGALRPQDTIARLGGDEFGVLLPETGRDDALACAERLCQHLAEPFRLRRLSLHVATSVGVTLFPDHGLDATELIQRADVAMYMAKRKRAGIALYDPEKDFNTVRHLALSSQLRQAIKDDGLLLFFQPKVSIETGRMVGVEALVRWEHPQHGMLPPDEFIALAEHSGLIKPLTRWVLNQALRQCAAWRSKGLDLTVSVNLSARNLEEKDLPQMLQQMLDRHEVPADSLILEITESVIMEDPDRSLEILTGLSELGLRISIDDFGTGYSSLSYLKKLPADELKIDRSFVKELDGDEDDAVIVRSTIEMAHNLGLKVIAEGIETKEIWEQLRDFGCDEGQGFFFGRPVPGSESLARMTRVSVEARFDEPETPPAAESGASAQSPAAAQEGDQRRL